MTGNVYGNYIYGDGGCGLNALIYEETQNNGHVTVNTFNNVLVDGGSVSHAGCGKYLCQNSQSSFTDISGLIANNTIVGQSNYSATNAGVGVATGTSGVSVYNNVFMNMHEYTSGPDHTIGLGLQRLLQCKRNLHQLHDDQLRDLGQPDQEFSQWQAFGFDANGLGQSNAVPSSPLLVCQITTCYGAVSALFIPTVNSPMLGTGSHPGSNLYSSCNGQPNPGLGALCYDLAGFARPTSAAWDMGAYQYVQSSGLKLGGGFVLSGAAHLN